jgi:hypothetical protein
MASSTAAALLDLVLRASRRGALQVVMASCSSSSCWSLLGELVELLLDLLGLLGLVADLFELLDRFFGLLDDIFGTSTISSYFGISGATRSKPHASLRQR